MQDNVNIFPEHLSGDSAEIVTPALPVSLTQLVGREREVEAIRDLLLRPHIRLLTLNGTAGVGKTRLALEVVRGLVNDFADGVHQVLLAPLSDPTSVMPTIARSLGLSESASLPVLEQIKTSQQSKQQLLLLDNFEHVIEAAPLLVELLEACPALKLLATSREVLRLRGEQQFAVPPLALPDPSHLPDAESLAQVAAVRLFLQRSQAVRADFQLTPDNAATIAEICLRLDGLPLTIELAAARIKLLAPQALLARLDRRLQVLIGGARDLPARQQTLRHTIAWSYDLLDASERQLFRCLSIFVDGCELSAAEAVCAALPEHMEGILEGVASLLDKSLLYQREQPGQEPRIAMLETIREYGLECLTASGELEITQRTHAVYYLTLAEEAQPYLQRAEQIKWFARLEQERENLRTALSWLLEHAHMEVQTEERKEQSKRALRLCVALFPFWDFCGYIREGWTFLERALAMREGVDASLRARILYNAGFLLWDMGDMERSEMLTEESLTLYRELGETAGAARTLTLLGAVVWQRSQYATARALDEEAAALFQQVDDTWGRGRCLTDLARMATAQGEYDRARALLEESLALYRALGDKQRIGWVLCLLARVLFESQDDLTRAAALVEQSLMLQREVGAKSFIAAPLLLLAEIHLAQGEQARARERIEEFLVVCKEVGYGWFYVEGLMCQARVLAFQGDYATAHALYQESFALLHKTGNKEPFATCLEGLGALAVQGQPVWAARLWGAAETIRQHIGTPLPPIYRAGYEQAAATARSTLGEKAFAAAWAEGRTMTPEQALTAEGQPIPITPIPPMKPVAAYPDGLTSREVEVLRLLAQGLTDAQIAERLIISPRTVNNHLTSIYSKIQVSSRAAATRYTIEHHLI